MKFSLTVGIVWALSTGCIFVIAAPSQSAEQINKPEARSAAEISDKELNAFAKAYVEYQNIRASYGPALERAKDGQEKTRIEHEANRKVKRSLEVQGLSAERYNKIFATVNGNPGLRQKVLKKVEDERQKS